MKKLRILIVEDDVAARIALESVLTDITSVAVIAKRSVAGASEVWVNDSISPLLMFTRQMVTRLGWRLL